MQDMQLQEATIGIAEWNKDLVNCVSLIGRLGGPLEVRETPYSPVRPPTPSPPYP